MSDLTKAEQAAAEALAERHNEYSDTDRLAAAAFAGEARAVVAAVRPHFFDEAAEHLVSTCPHITEAARDMGNLQRAHRCCGHHMDAIKELREHGHKVPAARQSGEGQH